MMTKADFETAKLFIYTDIQREINLARTKIGSGNFLAALGLLCYTEFAGGLIPGNSKKSAGAKFNDFFDLLGYRYKNFRLKHNAYSIFRCGLAHEYFVKKDCIIAIFITGNRIGIGRGKKGNYYFAVERYFQDFKKAFDKLGRVLYP